MCTFKKKLILILIFSVNFKFNLVKVDKDGVEGHLECFDQRIKRGILEGIENGLWQQILCFCFHI